MVRCNCNKGRRQVGWDCRRAQYPDQWRGEEVGRQVWMGNNYRGEGSHDLEAAECHLDVDCGQIPKTDCGDTRSTHVWWGCGCHIDRQLLVGTLLFLLMSLQDPVYSVLSCIMAAHTFPLAMGAYDFEYWRLYWNSSNMIDAHRAMVITSTPTVIQASQPLAPL